MNPIRRAWQLLGKQGPRVLVQKGIVRVFPFVLDRPVLVARQDVLDVDWRSPHPWIAEPRAVAAGPTVVAWVMSPPGGNSGGHQNIFRFIRVMEQAGHEVRVYLHSTVDPTTAAEARARVESSSSYSDVKASIELYPEAGIPDDVDALVATGWETAYRSYRDSSRARRFYFVQDFEPLFAPAGSEAVLAENTYRFGFIGLTAGGWLSQKLSADYDMTATPFDFGAGSDYSVVERGRRSAVFFYARPETPRRGYEIGEMALELFARERPESAIILAGQDLRGRDIPFPHENPGNMQVGQLNALYNRCAAGLVLSFTNMSLLPLELLSAGVIPVVNDGPNNRLVSDNPFIEYTQPTPRALADRLIEIVDRADQQEHAQRAAESVAGSTWARAGEQFLAGFERGIRG